MTVHSNTQLHVDQPESVPPRSLRGGSTKLAQIAALCTEQCPCALKATDYCLAEARYAEQGDDSRETVFWVDWVTGKAAERRHSS